ncbi:DUF309 domain-containing protein [Geoanaerobacter pelophilus]|uniref:DUF309 domain-containing protein n=1 Tax=Geoanaerobacter pelophilus TaxID=60036 RepID=UPI000A26A0AF|nr:DUF309 domain-containing protein [Geoanaerobacter pelophilus]
MPCRANAPPGELVKAVEEFNRGEWFECHETLEELWVGEKGELRDFYQGVLQIAVALHHWRNGNFKGALILLQGGGECLRRVSSVCLKLDVAQLQKDAARFLDELSALGEERMAEVDPGLVPRLHLLS